MTTNTQYVSIWDAAHHWHGIAVPIEPSPLPPTVRNTVTALLVAILDSILGVYEPIVLHSQEGDGVDRSSLYMHHVERLPAEFEDMYLSGVYDSAILAAYRVDIDDLLWWCASNGEEEVPHFCISDRFYAKPEPSTETKRFRPEAEDRRLCQDIAKRVWATDERIRIAEMARRREIQIEGNGALYRPVTVIGWLREVAPAAVRNRRGRPVKKEEE